MRRNLLPGESDLLLQGEVRMQCVRRDYGVSEDEKNEE